MQPPSFSVGKAKKPQIKTKSHLILLYNSTIPVLMVFSVPTSSLIRLLKYLPRDCWLIPSIQAKNSIDYCAMLINK